MQEKLDERRAESHGISHRNPGHLALANPTLYSARDSGKANTQVTEPPINTDPDQESSGSLMLQTPFCPFHPFLPTPGNHQDSSRQFYLSSFSASVEMH